MRSVIAGCRLKGSTQAGTGSHAATRFARLSAPRQQRRPRSCTPIRRPRQNAAQNGCCLPLRAACADGAAVCGKKARTSACFACSKLRHGIRIVKRPEGGALLMLIERAASYAACRACSRRYAAYMNRAVVRCVAAAAAPPAGTADSRVNRGRETPVPEIRKQPTHPVPCLVCRTSETIRARRCRPAIVGQAPREMLHNRAWWPADAPPGAVPDVQGRVGRRVRTQPSSACSAMPRQTSRSRAPGERQ